MVSMVAAVLLMHISRPAEYRRLPVEGLPAYTRLGTALLAGFALCMLAAGWWGVVRTEALLARTDNPRRSLADLRVRRGSLLDRQGRLISVTLGTPGNYRRYIYYPPLSNVIGYNHPAYGQAGLEGSLDSYLRGVQGYPELSIWWNHLLYGEPLPGLDVRLSLDLSLQRQADRELQGEIGAILMINAESGEILVMSSHPTFDANFLAEQWEHLVRRKEAPLLNRVLLGNYPAEELIGRLSLKGQPYTLPQPLTAFRPASPEGQPSISTTFSPLQAGMLASALSNSGELAPLRLTLSVHTPHEGWVILPPLIQAAKLYEEEIASQLISNEIIAEGVWGVLLPVHRENDTITWFVGGTLNTWLTGRYAIVVLLEAYQPVKAKEIAMHMLNVTLP